jgi:hypothetical protein
VVAHFGGSLSRWKTTLGFAGQVWTERSVNGRRYRKVIIPNTAAPGWRLQMQATLMATDVCVRYTLMLAGRRGAQPMNGRGGLVIKFVRRKKM